MRPRHLPVFGLIALGGLWWGYRSLERMNNLLKKPYGPDAF